MTAKALLRFYKLQHLTDNQVSLSGPSFAQSKYKPRTLIELDCMWIVVLLRLVMLIEKEPGS